MRTRAACDEAPPGPRHQLAGAPSPPFRPVEENPHRKVGRKVFETVLLERGHKNEGSALHLVSGTSIKELRPAPGHDMDLVAGMQLLWIDTLR